MTLDEAVVHAKVLSSKSATTAPAHVLHSPTDHHPHEVTYDGSRIFWRSGGFLQCSFLVSGPVKKVVFHEFEGGEAPHLCILQERSLRLLNVSQTATIIPLESSFSDILEFQYGLILSGAADSPPKLLTNASEDLRAIPIDTSARSMQAGESGMQNERFLWASTESSHMVTFNQRIQKLRLWQSKPVSSRQHANTSVPHNWNTPQASKPLRTAMQTPISAGGVRRSSIRLANGHVSPAIFSPVPQTLARAGVPPPSLLPEPSLPFNFSLLAEDHLLPEMVPESFELIHGLGGELMLALLIRQLQRVTVVSLSDSTMLFKPVMEKEALCIASVSRPDLPSRQRESREQSLVRLDGSGRLFVHLGNFVELQVYIEPQSSIPTGFARSSGAVHGNMQTRLESPRSPGTMDIDDPQMTAKFLQVQGSCNGAVHLTDASNRSILVSIPQIPDTGLACLVYEALQYMLEPDSLQNLLLGFWNNLGQAEGSASEQWNALEASILQLLCIPNNESGAFGTQKDDSEKRRRCIQENGYVWAYNSLSTSSIASKSSKIQRQPQADETGRVLEALHALYEDFKLQHRKWIWLPKLGSLLHAISSSCGMFSFADAYQRDNCSQQMQQCTLEKHASKINGRALVLPASMLNALTALLNGEQAELWLSSIHHAQPKFLQCSTDVLLFYNVIAKESVAINARQPGTSVPKELLIQRSHALINALLKKNWKQSHVEGLAFGVSCIIKQIISQSQQNPLQGWSPQAFELIQRADIVSNNMVTAQEKGKAAPKNVLKTERVYPPLTAQAALLKPQLRTPAPGGTSRTRLSLDSDPLLAAAAVTTSTSSATNAGPQLPAQKPAQLRMPYEQPLPLSGVDWDQEEGETSEVPLPSDGMETLVHIQKKQRFGADHRLMEVRRLLRSSVPVALHIQGRNEIAEKDIPSYQQRRLMGLGIRTMTLPLGRAALTLGTLRPLPTEPLDIPPLNLSGTLPEQQNAVVDLDLNVVSPAPGGGAAADFTAWPEFHNGVAAGLRLAPGGAQMTRTWIVYNKPKEPSYTHAGMLMGLGLTGHLNCLSATDLYKYLSQEHDATTAGVLLGMSAAKRGTCDATISRMLFLHLPLRDPAISNEIEVSNLVQTAAFMGVGLLYLGSCHRMTAEILLEEIGQSPGTMEAKATAERQVGVVPPIVADREGYSLSAGLALGLVCLGHGRRAVGLADLKIESRLRYYINGGRKPPALSKAGRIIEGDTMATAPPGHHGAIGFDPSLPQDLPWGQGLSLSDNKLTDEATAAQNKVNLVIEGKIANLDVTAPGGIMALALMYLQTNDRSMAELVSIPSTYFELDLVRPDYIVLRMLARCLILWDSVTPSYAFAESQLPPIIKGPISALGWSAASAKNRRIEAEEEDPESVQQAHLHALTGLLLGIGIKYAGSADAGAKKFLIEHVKYFTKEKLMAPDPCLGAKAVWGRLDKQNLENCMNLVVLALALVMAGTGDLECCTIFRGLQRRLSQGTRNMSGAVFYGNHMSISMALGFLFYVGGSASFSNSKEATAALVVSLFPRFPLSPTDNRCHLQMFRHLHVLARENRSLEAIDIENGSSLRLPVQIMIQTSAKSKEQTLTGDLPYLLPPLNQIKELRIDSEAIHSWSMKSSQPGFMTLLKSGKIFLQKRKPGSAEPAPSGSLMMEELKEDCQQVVESSDKRSDGLENLAYSFPFRIGPLATLEDLMTANGTNLSVYLLHLRLAHTATQIQSEASMNVGSQNLGASRQLQGALTHIDRLMKSNLGDSVQSLQQYLSSGIITGSIEQATSLALLLVQHAIPSPWEFKRVSQGLTDKQRAITSQLSSMLTRSMPSTIQKLAELY